MKDNQFKGRTFIDRGEDFIDIADTAMLDFRGDSFIDKGSSWFNCGPTGAQQSALAADQAFQKAVTDQYKTTVGTNMAILSDLSAGLEKTFNAGPSQQGMSPAELAVENSQALNSAAAADKQVQQAIGEKAGVSGVVPGVESGVVQAERASAATQIENNLSNTQANITQKNYDIGRENYNNAAKGLMEAPAALESPINQAASEVTGANKETSDQANQNAAASNQWVGLVQGVAQDAAGAFGAYEGAHKS